MRLAVAITLWVLAIGLSTPLDRPVAQSLRESGWDAWIERDDDLRDFLKLPGRYLVIVLAAIVAWRVHRLGWRAGVFIIVATATSAYIELIKWATGRHRPFTWLAEQVPDLRPFDFAPFRGGWEGLFDARNLAFPSGHTALAFALAGALAILFPRGRWLFYAAATVTAVERVWENAHWLSDVVAGAGLGLLAVCAVAWLFRCVDPMFVLEKARMTVSEAVQQTSTSPAARLPVMASVEGSGAAGGLTGPTVSLVIPAYNEQENIPTLLSRVAAALERLGRPFEVVIVDDGSTDATPRLLAEGMAAYPWLRVVRMGRNGGQSAAFEAGFAAARGQLIATIDADLQNDPEEIPRLVALLEERGVDMITGWRKDRQDTPFRRWQSRQANRIRNWISQETVNDSASSLKVYRAEAIRGLKLFNGAHRFFPTLVKMRGFTCYETPVKHSPRFAGTAKYGFRNRALRAFLDLLAVRWMKSRWLNYTASEVPATAVRPTGDAG